MTLAISDSCSCFLLTNSRTHELPMSLVIENPNCVCWEGEKLGHDGFGHGTNPVLPIPILAGQTPTPRNPHPPACKHTHSNHEKFQLYTTWRGREPSGSAD